MAKSIGLRIKHVFAFLFIAGFSCAASARNATVACLTNLTIAHEIPASEALEIIPGSYLTNYRVLWKNQEVILAQTSSARSEYSPTLLAVFLKLVSDPHTVFSVDEIYQSVWGAGGDKRQAVVNAISSIRKSFQAVDPTFSEIKNIRRTGYVWSIGEPDFRIGELLVYKGAKRLEWKGEDVHVTANQFNMLLPMFEHPNQTISFENLYQAYGSPFTIKERAQMLHSLRVEMTNIRNSFRKADGEFDALKNVKGKGMTWSPPNNVIPFVPASVNGDADMEAIPAAFN